MTETFSFDDILIKPKAFSTIRSRSDVSTEVSLYELRLSLPAMSASMSIFDTKSNSRNISYKFATAMHEAGGIHIFSRATKASDRIKAVKSLAALGINSGMAVSLTEFEVCRGELMSLPKESILSIDIANGSIIKDISWIADDELPTLVLGNYGNPGAVLRRDLDGKIAFKMGIGSGTGCTTRTKTGVGAPQAWLINETEKFSRKPIISDGGIKNVSDFVKAIALGAEFAMMGRVFAEAEETPWEPVKGEDGKWYKPYRGMASFEEKGVQSYIEGEFGYVPYHGKSVKQIMTELKEGLTSAMSYSDSATLEEFHQKKEFLRVTPSTVYENGTRLHEFQ